MVQARHRGDVALRDRVARQHQQCCTGRHVELARLRRVGQHGLDDLLGLGQRGVREEHGRGRDLREVALHEARRQRRVHVPILQLDRHAVLEVHEAHVEHRAALAQPHRGGDAGVGLLALDRQHARHVDVAAFGDLLVDVAHLQHVGDRVQLRHVRARALAALDEALVLQLAQRVVHRHAGAAELLHQLSFGRQLHARLPAALGDALADRGLDVLGRQAAWRGGRGHGFIVSRSMLKLSRPLCGARR